jgi:hypothetical protein
MQWSVPAARRDQKCHLAERFRLALTPSSVEKATHSSALSGAMSSVILMFVRVIVESGECWRSSSAA